MPPARVLGGKQARTDVQEHAKTPKFFAVHICDPMRPDLKMQTEDALKEAELTAEAFEAAEDAEVASAAVINAEGATATEDGFMIYTDEQKATLGPLAVVGARGKADAHIKLWKRVAAGDLPCLILEDGIKTFPRLANICAHLVSVVERVVAEDERSVLLFVGADVLPTDWTAQWLPTDMAHPPPVGKPIKLGEATSVISGSFSYLVWPLAARRLIANLPLHTTVDDYIGAQMKKDRVRSLVVQPYGLTAPMVEKYQKFSDYAMNF